MNPTNWYGVTGAGKDVTPLFSAWKGDNQLTVTYDARGCTWREGPTHTASY